MSISLSERIAKNQNKKKDVKNSVNKVAFIALKKDITEAISDGWSNKAIWETLSSENRISFSYKTFCQYVARYVDSPYKTVVQENTKEDKKVNSKPKNEIRGFTYNPKPNLEELL